MAMSIKIVSGNHARYSRGEELILWRELGKTLTSKKLIMQNASYDTGVLILNHGINCINNLWMDTLLAAHCLWPETPRDLGYLASLCLDVPAWKHTSKEDPVMYNAADAANTFGIAEFLYKDLVRTGNLKTFEFEMSEIAPSLLMQLKGLPVDISVRDELVKEHTQTYKETEAELNKILGKKVNFNSAKQVQNLLYIDLGLPVQYKRRKKASDPRKITAGAEAIKKLSKLVPNNPIFNLLLKYKKSFKLVSSFLEIEVSPTNCVHTSYNITGSSTDDTGRKSFGRWSSSESIILPYGSGNLQNIPEEARKMYRAAPGYVILCADYVQAEAVVVAYLANDFKLKKLFKDRLEAKFEDKGKFDVHRFTAAHMFGVDVDKVTKEMRQVGKTLRHATNYSAGPGVVSAKLGCTMTIAKQLLERYFNANPQLRVWHQSIQNQLREDKVLTTPLGRKHRFLDRWGDSLFRPAYSYLPQSTVGDLMNQSIVDIYKYEGDWLDMWLQLHDGTYFHVRKDLVEKAVIVLRKHMMREIEVNHDTMLIEVDFKAGQSWGELEDLPY
jgi:DNA polymerase-1